VKRGRRADRDNVVTDLAARIGSRIEPDAPVAETITSAPQTAESTISTGPRLEPVVLAPRAGPLALGAAGQEERTSAPVPAEQTFAPPGPGELDLVVAPLPFADDRHQFESAVRRLPGVVETSGLYHRRGVYRMRVVYRGDGRLSQQIRALRGFRVRVLAEDRKLVQVLIEPESLAPA
jgi:hypothetical protein